MKTIYRHYLLLSNGSTINYTHYSYSERNLFLFLDRHENRNFFTFTMHVKLLTRKTILY